jgi:hypothetical protein
MAKQRSNRKMGRNSDDLEPGRVNVADVVDIAGSREEITLIFFVFLYVSQPLGFHKPTEENEREPAKGRKIISN